MSVALMALAAFAMGSMLAARAVAVNPIGVRATIFAALAVRAAIGGAMIWTLTTFCPAVLPLAHAVTVTVTRFVGVRLGIALRAIASTGWAVSVAAVLRPASTLAIPAMSALAVATFAPGAVFARSLRPAAMPAVTAFGTLAIVGMFGRGFDDNRRIVATILVRDLLTRQSFDSPQEIALFGVAKRNSGAGCAGSGGAADAVHIRFRNFWQFVVDDVGDEIDVDTAGRDVGRDKYADARALEVFEGELALTLAFVAVNGGGGDFRGFEMTGDAVGAAFRARKNERARHFGVGQKFGQ